LICGFFGARFAHFLAAAISAAIGILRSIVMPPIAAYFDIAWPLFTSAPCFRADAMSCFDFGFRIAPHRLRRFAGFHFSA
jgi:hypothetical protein